MSTITHKHYLGKCDGYGNGSKSCEAYITWDFDEEKGTFGAQAEIWNHRKTDTIMGGQCLDEVAAYFPEDKKAQAILKVWHEWHLNDMTAGSPDQQAFLKAHKAEFEAQKATKGLDHYDWANTTLWKAGLNPDPNFFHNDKPYEYGHAWLKRELPAEVVTEIKSWSE